MNPELSFERQPHAWLADAHRRYEEAPDRSDRLLDEGLAVFETLPDAPPQHLPVLELCLLALQWALEQRRMPEGLHVVNRALAWAEQGHEPKRLRPRLWCVAARLFMSDQRLETAAGLLGRAQKEWAETQDKDLIGSAALLNGLALLAQKQGDLERALALARRALSLAQLHGDGGPWMQAEVLEALLLRALARDGERREALERGAQRTRSLRRWGEAANLQSGLVDMAVESGDWPAAERLLAEGDALLEAGELEPRTVGYIAMKAARARWLAASGHPAQACALMEPMLESVRTAGSVLGQLRCLDALVGWKAQQGLGREALALSRRAHALRLEHIRDKDQGETLHLRQEIERTQAETERLEHAQRATQAQAQQRSLQASLDQLRTLQSELAERRQQASMGSLLAGVAHELNTPLGTALTSLSGAAQMSRSLLDVSAGAIGRSTLLSRLDALCGLQRLALRNLQRALALIETYRATTAVDAAAATLERVVERAWGRALAPGHALQLELDDRVGKPVWPGAALEEILVQMFQNIDRHAYGLQRSGRVQVVGSSVGADALLLTVQDQGRGIAPELLPRVFEPYVSTQFGQGRSGLGLFIAHSIAQQQAGGHLRVRSQPGQGSCFEIQCQPVQTA